MDDPAERRQSSAKVVCRLTFEVYDHVRWHLCVSGGLEDGIVAKRRWSITSNHHSSDLIIAC